MPYPRGVAGTVNSPDSEAGLIYSVFLAVPDNMTGNLMAGSDLEERHVYLPARGNGVPASGMESTSSGRIKRISYLAQECRGLFDPARHRLRDCLKKGLGVGMFWIIENLFRIPQLYYFTHIHYGYLIGNML